MKEPKGHTIQNLRNGGLFATTSVSSHLTVLREGLCQYQGPGKEFLKCERGAVYIGFLKKVLVALISSLGILYMLPPKRDPPTPPSYTPEYMRVLVSVESAYSPSLRLHAIVNY